VAPVLVVLGREPLGQERLLDERDVHQVDQQHDESPLEMRREKSTSASAKSTVTTPEIIGLRT
jgi:hypothetical protein